MLNLTKLITNNILVCGESGAGKSYLLHRLLNEIIDNNLDDNYQIYIDDPKLYEFQKEYNYLNIYNYNFKKIMVIIIDRIREMYLNYKPKFNPVYIIYDELGERLPSQASINNNYERLVKLGDSFLSIIRSDMAKDLNIHIFAAIQNPKMLTPMEINKIFDYYIETTNKNQTDINSYVPILKEKLGEKFNKLNTLCFDERILNIYRNKKI